MSYRIPGCCQDACDLLIGLLDLISSDLGYTDKYQYFWQCRLFGKQVISKHVIYTTISHQDVLLINLIELFVLNLHDLLLCFSEFGCWSV